MAAGHGSLIDLRKLCIPRTSLRRQRDVLACGRGTGEPAMGWLRDLLAVSFVLLFLVAPAQAEKRVALVIGNSAYRHAPELINPRNDAGDIAARLGQLGTPRPG
jgi:hypothetical protein